METTLKACPFCGSNKIYNNSRNGYTWFQCEPCGAEGPFRIDYHEAIECWNNRTGDGEMTGIISAILAELHRAEQLHPDWPTDLIHQIAIMSEEAGEVIKAGNDVTFSEGDIDDVRAELIQTAAMCIRVYKNLPKKEGEA